MVELDWQPVPGPRPLRPRQEAEVASLVGGSLLPRGPVLGGASRCSRLVVQRVLCDACVKGGLWDARRAIKDRFGLGHHGAALERPALSARVLRDLNHCV